jgi:hypothetical protein
MGQLLNRSRDAGRHQKTNLSVGELTGSSSSIGQATAQRELLVRSSKKELWFLLSVKESPRSRSSHDSWLGDERSEMTELGVFPQQEDPLRLKTKLHSNSVSAGPVEPLNGLCNLL